MKIYNKSLSISPTDLSYFLSCRHRAALELSVAHGVRKRPSWKDPLVETLVERGLRHEANYVQKLRDSGKSIVDLSKEFNREAAVTRTADAMKSGTDVIVQGGLANEQWFGRPDVLLKVPQSSELGAWSYEPADAKLAIETRGGTILQLGLYCELLTHGQGRSPEQFHVISPASNELGFQTLSFRFQEYAAYFRFLKRTFTQAVDGGHEKLQKANEAEPVDHCTVCPWWRQCYDWWQEVDHLCLVAGISSTQRQELVAMGVTTMEALSQLSDQEIGKIKNGSASSYQRVREQARVQVESRRTGQTVYERITPTDEGDAKPIGLARLPEPSPGDIFLDLEGDRLASDGGRDYLFGLVIIDKTGAEQYHYWWAETEAQEKAAFEAAVDFICERLESFPDLHVYHYAPYEVTAFKRLMGRYATREGVIDQFLRGHRFVDLYGVVVQGVRVGIEQYSIKNLEPLYNFEREAELKDASRALPLVAQALELGRRELLSPELKKTVEIYNKDDCVSTRRLRDWLEIQRSKLIASGFEVKRPEQPPSEASEAVAARAREVAALRSALLECVPPEPADRTASQQANYQLAYLLDWHTRENKVSYWERFRLRALPEDELFEERKAVAGLSFVGEVGRQASKVVQRYEYPSQELEVREGESPMTLHDGKTFGEIVNHIPESCTIDMLVGPSKQHERPTAVAVHCVYRARAVEDAIFSLGEQVSECSEVAHLAPSPQRALLLRETPRLTQGSFAPPESDEETTTPEYAANIVAHLDRTTLAIQGPPGSGKTYTGAKMILAALQAGLKVGVTAGSHKVINNLLSSVVEHGAAAGTRPSVGHKGGTEVPGIVYFEKNDGAEAALSRGNIQVLGGTAWLWARPEFEDAVDLLFVDEAGQMSLANVLGVARAAKSLVLLGDPQQLEQPSKGSHPDGAGLSALQHILGDAETMPPERGLFLSETWRMAPSICQFTSELFYAGQLRSRPGLEQQELLSGTYQGNGLWLHEVEHTGNANSSDEEAVVVENIVHELLGGQVQWRNQEGDVQELTPNDIRVVAPFNAQVNRLYQRFRNTPYADVPVGTVDMFQGQEAAVVIYSMASSRPEDAPRGMEFLYSANRLNVATSRARCTVILVASPKLFEPDCQTPRQMKLANGVCWYWERADKLRR